MNTELTVYEAESGERSELEQLEFEINHAAYEAFVFIGVRLLRIRTKELYRQVTDESTGKPYKSWSAYCAAGRIEYSKGNADRLIRASVLRQKVGAHALQFSVRQMEELAKCESDLESLKRVELEQWESVPDRD